MTDHCEWDMQFRELLAREKEYAEPETTYVEAPPYEGDGENTMDSNSIWYSVIIVYEVVAFYDSTGQELSARQQDTVRESRLPARRKVVVVLRGKVYHQKRK